MEDKTDRTLEEAAQVRADFGYPIMVTPLSQFVGSQAAINVIVGERYKQVTDQTIEYAIGVWGKEGANLMDSNIKDKILGRPRAREIAERKPPQQTLRELRRRHGGQGVSDEEILLRFLTSKDAVDQMHAAGSARIYTAHNPLLTLIEQLTKQTHSHTVYIQKGAFSLRLEKRSI
jgi:oxaloacetate decarboxylase alpha subunit